MLKPSTGRIIFPKHLNSYILSAQCSFIYRYWRFVHRITTIELTFYSAKYDKKNLKKLKKLFLNFSIIHLFKRKNKKTKLKKKEEKIFYFLGAPPHEATKSKQTNKTRSLYTSLTEVGSLGRVKGKTNGVHLTVGVPDGGGVVIDGCLDTGNDGVGSETFTKSIRTLIRVIESINSRAIGNENTFIINGTILTQGIDDNNINTISTFEAIDDTTGLGGP